MTNGTLHPTHRWRANENADVTPFSIADFCIECKVPRYDPMPTEMVLRRNAVAAGPCPLAPWTSMPDEWVDAAVETYTADLYDDANTPEEQA